MSKKITWGYVLKTVNKDMKAHNGFLYPKKGLVKADDFNTEKKCGGGVAWPFVGRGKWGFTKLG